MIVSINTAFFINFRMKNFIKWFFIHYLQTKSDFFSKMADLIFHSELQHKSGKLTINLELLLFKEDDVYIIYSPALDISAFASTEEGVKEDFGNVITSYLEYGMNKKTLWDDLRRHGWEVKSKKRIKAPSDEQLFRINDTYKDIKENKEYKTIQREVAIPTI